MSSDPIAAASGGDARAPRLLRPHRPTEPYAAVAVARQPRHAGANQRLLAGRVVLQRHPRGDARSRRPDHREGGRAARAHPRESRAARAVEDHDRSLCRRAARAARARSRPPTGMRKARSASSSKAAARTRPSTANGRSCTTATSSSRRRWRGTITATRATQPIFWLDGLDIPIVQFLDASFAEHHDEDEQPVSRPAGDSEARFGSNLLPVDHQPRSGASPVFNYPYARTREALERLRRTGGWDPCHGLKMRYTNPVTGGYPMTTIAAFIQLLPKGFATAPYRSTDATCSSPSRGADAPASARTSSSSGSRATSSWCRAGSRSRTRPPRTRCCSRSPIGRFRKRFTSFARSVAMPESRGERSRRSSPGGHRGVAGRGRTSSAGPHHLGTGCRRLVGDGYPLSRSGIRALLDGTGGGGDRTSAREVGTRPHRSRPPCRGRQHVGQATAGRRAGDSTGGHGVSHVVVPAERCRSRRRSDEQEPANGPEVCRLHRRSPDHRARREAHRPDTTQRDAISAQG